MSEELDVSVCRSRFPALARESIFFDGAAGSQVPQSVIDAMAAYMIDATANTGGLFPTSNATDDMLRRAREAVADFLGTDDPDTVVFGPNMTSLTFKLSGVLGRTWSAGDEIVVTRLDHDANVTPWVLAAEQAGAVVRHCEIDPATCTLDLGDLRRIIGPRTRLVAVGAASNAVGTINPIAEIAAIAHGVGAQLFVDAVHYAPHRFIDVTAWDCDYLVCSAYKFFGPHAGIFWAKREHLENLQPPKVRPTSDALPDRWMTGTQNHEGIAGLHAAISYLEQLGNGENRRAAIRSAFDGITLRENTLSLRMLRELPRRTDWKILGITDPAQVHHRVPTFACVHPRIVPDDAAAFLAQQGIYSWNGNAYALPLTERLGLEPQGFLRLSLLHYNAVDEIERCIAALETMEKNAG